MMPAKWAWLEIHDLIFIGVVLVLFGALGGGPLLKALLNAVLKFFGKGTSETIINNNFAQDRRDMAIDRIAMAGDREHMAGDREHMAGDRQQFTDDRVAMAMVQAIMSGNACLITDACKKCGEEHLRSIQNQKEIGELKEQHHEDRDLFWKELKVIRRGITCITNGLLAKQIIDPRDLPREES